MTDIDSVDGKYILEAACQYVNDNHPEFPDIEVKDIVGSKLQDDYLVILADCGIKGIPRFSIPADKLEFNPKSIPEPKPKRATNGRRKRGVKNE